MEPLYEPHAVEERWQRTWEEEGLYRAEPDPSRERFVIAHPPPNVTGELHMGHALQLALADTLVRWQRMLGKNVLFQPGYDHAGISTQNAVEKDLARIHEEREDSLVYARYALADGDGFVTVATARPATILADVAVAVHPDDERYRDVVGKEVVVPFVERRGPVLAGGGVGARVCSG